MHGYPIYIDISGRTCLVVGGGRVGLRKVKSLLSAGATVRVVEPNPSNALRDLSGLQLLEREFEDADLEGVFLVFLATSRADVNEKIATLCKGRNLFCNVADAPERSDFIVPATVKRGGLSIAISTEGASPALSRKLRMDLEERFDAAYGPYLEILRGIRSILLLEGHDPDGHRDLFREIVNGPMLSWIREGDIEGLLSGLPERLRDRRDVESLIRTIL